jgi:predicted metal-dependent phosphoesterase TrpH
VADESLSPSVDLRADLHVHSCHSKVNGNVPFLRSRDCYSRPDDIYRVAKARGMDLVTITDHDSIDGCLEFLDRHPDAPDFIIGEEVSCRMPDTDLDVHFGVYGMSESLHRDVQPLRDNAFDVACCLRQAGVFFALNHLFHFYREQVPLEAYLRLLAEVPALEVRNGTMLTAHNELVEDIRRGWNEAGTLAPRRALAPLVAVAGSDAHTLRRIGTTWTAAPAGSTGEYIAALAEGRGRAGGAHGCALAVASDAYGVISAYCRSLLGFGPNDHGLAERVAFIAFAIVSLPAEFLPLALSLRGKAREARFVERCAEVLRNRPGYEGGSVAAPLVHDQEAVL